MTGELRRNIELKARLRDPAFAHSVAQRIATEYVGVERQIDTYFRVPHGRLKLREIDGGESRLVAYERPDDLQAKASDYRLLPVIEPQRLKELLSASLGVVAVVDKRHTIYLFRNVRIHLDEVAGLGAFLEFEAVLDPAAADAASAAAAGHAQLTFLSGEFRLRPDDLLAQSYGEMLGVKSTQSG